MSTKKNVDTISPLITRQDGEKSTLTARKLVKKLGPPQQLWMCYDAGPTGYVLYWLLTSLGVKCDVVAVAGAAPVEQVSIAARQTLSGGWQGTDAEVHGLGSGGVHFTQATQEYTMLDYLQRLVRYKPRSAASRSEQTLPPTAESPLNCDADAVSE